jgi:chromosome segregation ATPase
MLREDESIIKDLENERTKLLGINSELKSEIKEFTKSLRSRDNDITNKNKDIENLNADIHQLNITVRDLEFKLGEVKSELNEKSFVLQKETRTRMDREKDGDILNNLLKEKEREIKKYLDELDFIQSEKDKLYDDNTKMFNELDRLKKHIYIITEQNQQVNKNFFLKFLLVFSYVMN